MQKTRLKRHLGKLVVVAILPCIFNLTSLPTWADASQSTAVTVTFIRHITSESLPGREDVQQLSQNNLAISSINPKEQVVEKRLPQTGSTRNYLVIGIGTSLITLAFTGIFKKRKT
ncbi:LPXTG cell wall anchor domain-containing protein [Enterococcus hirae]|uniref:LPXTG cell wall anchor domain-containing protein n=1 Tax=Enterococcus hirae TaxID=1354 RepID=UPI003982D1A3